jgi:peptidoglycan/LPS O-acetylase OafA/YrhL
MESFARRRSPHPVFAAGVLSLGAGVAWTAVEFARGRGYWSWPASWSLLAGAWALLVGMVFLAWRPRLVAIAVPVSLAAAILGGFATLLAWLMIYGTGD